MLQAEFKKVSETLQSTVRELMASKADRAELLELHESRFGDAVMNDKVCATGIYVGALYCHYLLAFGFGCSFLPRLSVCALWHHGTGTTLTLLVCCAAVKFT